MLSGPFATSPDPHRLTAPLTPSVVWSHLPPQRRAKLEAIPAPSPLRNHQSGSMANSNLPRRIIKVRLPIWSPFPALARSIVFLFCSVESDTLSAHLCWWLICFEFGSVQETQRLLSEPGAWLIPRESSRNFGAIRSLLLLLRWSPVL
jgi:hypothetical protein